MSVLATHLQTVRSPGFGAGRLCTRWAPFRGATSTVPPPTRTGVRGAASSASASRRASSDDSAGKRYRPACDDPRPVRSLRGGDVPVGDGRGAPETRGRWTRALCHALAIAREHRRPFHVVFALVPEFANAGARRSLLHAPRAQGAASPRSVTSARGATSRSDPTRRSAPSPPSPKSSGARCSSPTSRRCASAASGGTP